MNNARKIWAAGILSALAGVSCWAWNTFWVASLMAPVYWGLVCASDGVLVRSVYRNPEEGVVVSGIFSLIPIAFSLALSFGAEMEILRDLFLFQNGSSLCWLPLLAGIVGMSAYHAMFRGLDFHEDAATQQIVLNLGVVLTALLAFVFLGEVLSKVQWLAVAGLVLTSCGLELLEKEDEEGNGGRRKLLALSFVAMLLLSLCMLILKETEDRFMVGVYYRSSFWFFIGQFLYAVILVPALKSLIQGKGISDIDNGREQGSLPTGNIWKLIDRFFLIFLISELFQILGDVFSQRATVAFREELVSVVVAVGAITPATTMLASLVIGLIFKEVAAETEVTTSDWRRKTALTLVMAVCTYYVF